MATGRKQAAKLKRRQKDYETIPDKKRDSMKQPGSLNLRKQG